MSDHRLAIMKFTRNYFHTFKSSFTFSYRLDSDSKSAMFDLFESTFFFVHGNIFYVFKSHVEVPSTTPLGHPNTFIYSSWTPSSDEMMWHHYDYQMVSAYRPCNTTFFRWKLKLCLTTTNKPYGPYGFDTRGYIPDDHQCCQFDVTAHLCNVCRNICELLLCLWGTVRGFGYLKTISDPRTNSSTCLSR